MILKTAANYNDEGGYIEAWKKSDGTTEVKLIPKSGGGDEGKQGLKSISISPAITTTPAIDSLFPIYWDDLTDEEKAEGKKTLLLNVGSLTEGDTYTATITATDTWYAQGDGDWSEQGGSAEDTGTVSKMGDVNAVKFTFGASADPEDDNADYFELTIGITAAGQ